MVHLYRAAVYLIVTCAALLFYLLLRRLFGKGNRFIQLVASLLIAAGLIWGAHYVLSQPRLLAKYAPLLKIRKPGLRLKMVYMESEVRICNPDGSGDELFLAQDFITARDIAWSPDGTRFICSRYGEGGEGMNLYLYDADGENQFQLTTGEGIARRPSWSPDGTRIVFDFRPGSRRQPTDICVINADGSGRQRLLAGHQNHAYHPVWSPDGTSIYCCVKEGGRDDIWVMDAVGGNLRQLTFTPDQSETEPAISPEGGTIVYTVDRRAMQLMDADGGNPRPLITESGTPCRGRDPSWNPDGQRILYTGLGTKNSKRFITEVGVDGIGLRQIPVMDGKPLTPVLTPDGTRLTYLRFVRTVVRDVLPLGEPGGGPGLAAGE